MAVDSATLTRLRAFEAVGRHLSFTSAAAELAVTPTALSHQIRRLEDELGTRLFDRGHRAISLTRPGAELLGTCAHAFDTLMRATRNVRDTQAERPLVVSVAPFLSAQWLTPRLQNFWSTHPDVDVRLRHAYRPGDFDADDVDLALAWGDGRWPGTISKRIVAGDLTVLCSPRLAAELGPRPRPAGLARWPLFHEFDAAHWDEWFRAADARPTVDRRTVQVDDSHALRRVALEGDGPVLFFAQLSREDVRRGHLVRPFPVTVDVGSAYYLVRSRHRPMTEALRTFWAWVIDEAMLDPQA